MKNKSLPGQNQALISERGRSVLAAVIERHITTAEPVSSSRLCHQYGFDWSSATVRSIMARLEEAGFLASPYTSAGKIPTLKAYQYFITELMNEQHVTDIDQARIKAEVLQQVRETDQIMKLTARVLAMVSNLLAISWLPVHNVENLNSSRRESVLVEGAANLIHQPEFDDINAARQMVAMLDHREELLRFFTAPAITRGGVNVMLSENHYPAKLPALAFVSYRVLLDHGRCARIGVIGPRRMAYDRIVPLVEYTAEAFNQAVLGI